MKKVSQNEEEGAEGIDIQVKSGSVPFLARVGTAVGAVLTDSLVDEEVGKASLVDEATTSEETVDVGTVSEETTLVLAESTVLEALVEAVEDSDTGASVLLPVSTGALEEAVGSVDVGTSLEVGASLGVGESDEGAAEETEADVSTLLLASEVGKLTGSVEVGAGASEVDTGASLDADDDSDAADELDSTEDDVLSADEDADELEVSTEDGADEGALQSRAKSVSVGFDSRKWRTSRHQTTRTTTKTQGRSNRWKRRMRASTKVCEGRRSAELNSREEGKRTQELP